MDNTGYALRKPLRSIMLFSTMCLFLLAGMRSASGQTPPPVIEHTPIKTAPRGKPINIIAKIDGNQRKISAVTLYFRQSPDASPVSVEMQSTAVNTWVGTVPSSFVSGKGIIQYYIEAANDQGEWSETRYNTVNVTDPNLPESPSQPAPGPTVTYDPDGPATVKEGNSWLWPTVLIGGGALVVAGAIALADSGSDSSGGNTPNDNNGNNGGGGAIPDGPISERVITRFANDSVNGIGTFPSETIIDISDELGTRTVESVRIDLNLDPEDGFEELMQVTFGPATIIDTGPIIVPRTYTANADGDSPQVVIRVDSSRANDTGNNSYSWTATATFFLSN